MRITLSSAASVGDFPGNSWRAFSNRLPIALNVRDEQYECALVDVIFVVANETPAPWAGRVLLVETDIIAPQTFGSSTKPLLQLILPDNDRTTQQIYVNVTSASYSLVRRDIVDIVNVRLNDVAKAQPSVHEARGEVLVTVHIRRTRTNTEDDMDDAILQSSSANCHRHHCRCSHN